MFGKYENTAYDIELVCIQLNSWSLFLSSDIVIYFNNRLTCTHILEIISDDYLLMFLNIILQLRF